MIMKYLKITLLVLLFAAQLQGQSLVEKIAAATCEKVDTINNFNALEEALKKNVPIALSSVMMEGTQEEKSILSNVDSIRQIFTEVYENLPAYCPNVRRLLLIEKQKEFYKLSENVAANEYFDKGSEFLEKGDYKEAEKNLKLAIKEDSTFVYAIDHLAITYRRMEDYETAIKYYKKSLDIFPEGDLALLNIAVTYSFLQDYENAIERYDQLKFLYPNNPEGYFGLARLLFLTEDYENALDNLFIAHRIYTETNSQYLKDSERLFEMMKSKLTELNKTDLLKQKAKAHNIKIVESE